MEMDGWMDGWIEIIKRYADFLKQAIEISFKMLVHFSAFNHNAFNNDLYIEQIK